MELKEVECLLVEDDLQIGGYLKELLDRQQWVAGVTHVESLKDTSLALVTQSFDLIILDISLPDGCSIEEIPAFKRQKSPAKILIYTHHEDEKTVLSALSNGADGYLLKSTEEAELLSMIQSQMQGGTPMSPAIAGFLLNKIRRLPETQNPLSQRENETLKLLTKGCSYGEIATLIEVKKTTVATYIRRIYEKLGVNSRTEAIYEANNSGWLNFNDE